MKKLILLMNLLALSVNLLRALPVCEAPVQDALRNAGLQKNLITDVIGVSGDQLFYRVRAPKQVVSLINEIEQVVKKLSSSHVKFFYLPHMLQVLNNLKSKLCSAGNSLDLSCIENLTSELIEVSILAKNSSEGFLCKIVGRASFLGWLFSEDSKALKLEKDIFFLAEVLVLLEQLQVEQSFLNKEALQKKELDLLLNVVDELDVEKNEICRFVNAAELNNLWDAILRNLGAMSVVNMVESIFALKDFAIREFEQTKNPDHKKKLVRLVSVCLQSLASLNPLKYFKDLV